MKRIALVLSIVMLYASCKKNEIINNTTSTAAPTELISRASLDSKIKKTVISTGRFDWSSSTDLEIWSALQNSEPILAVGYKPASVDKDISASIDKIDISDPEWTAAKEAVLALCVSFEEPSNSRVNLSTIEAYDEAVLPVVYVWVKNLETVKALRQSRLVRYADPMGYEPEGFYDPNNPAAKTTSSSGCGSNVAVSGLQSGNDYVTLNPGSKQSWNYSYHHIPEAWNLSSGTGVTVMLIDGGVSDAQPLFGSEFNSGYSQGRTIQKKVTLRKSAWFGLSYGSVETSTNDDCGHGTSMAGALAGPRSAKGSAIGVAYNSNLITVRASTDVLIDEARETKGVTDAFTLAGNTAAVKIVSMSMGRITSSGSISDAIDYAYNKGKLIFCAGGTSFGWSAGWYGVIFPATKSNVNAVTGVDDRYNRCTTCHDGSQIDFTVVMEKSSNELHALSIAQSGYAPSTVGGSSVATATTAGIAALLWSYHPSWSRSQVLNRLIESSSNYPAKSGSLGWGMINAAAALE